MADQAANRFPAKTFDAIIQARPRGTQFATQEVQAIVLALDSPDSTVCERLDSLSLIILCSIFMYSQECLAQQRGLCLLTVRLSMCKATVTYNGQNALHQNQRHTAQEVAQKQAKKMAIGRAALTQLIKGFLKKDASDKLRRWVSVTLAPMSNSSQPCQFGILALELLEDCPENLEKLRSDSAPERHW